MARSYLVFDIETVQDPALPIVETSDADRLPPPPHHEIVAIGVLWFDGDYSVKRIGVVGEERNKGEAGVLRDFTKFLSEWRPDLITYNGRGFDLPVIVARCLLHGIPFPHYYTSRDVRYRFSPEGHLDLMDFLCDYGAARKSRLDTMARLSGMPGKLGVEGKDVGPMVHAGRLDEVRAYCLCDVVQTAGVFLRTQLLRGELDRDRYLGAMGNLMEAARAEPRLAPVCEAWNESRLLLREEAP